jgi:hypothetical protein
VAISLIEWQLGLRNGADDGRLDPVDTVEEVCNSRWRSPRRDRDTPAQSRSLIDSNVMRAASTKKLTASTGERELRISPYSALAPRLNRLTTTPDDIASPPRVRS